MKGKLIVIGVALAVSTQAAAQPASSSPVLDRVTACADVVDQAQRLACFDREVAALRAAQTSRQIVVVDQQQVRAARRQLFGLTLPDVGRLFGNDTDPGPQEIESRLTAVGTARTGLYALTLEDGSEWVQTQAAGWSREPRAGMPIKIRRGAVGSYLANIDGQRAIRVQRLR